MSDAHILLVDDEELSREAVKDLLEEAGFRVTAALNGREALSLMQQHGADLILSDVMMPEMDGHQLYREIRARPEWISTPFVFLTGLGEKVEVRYAKSLGVDDYLVKPVPPEDLVLAVKALLARRARLEAAREDQIHRLKEELLTMLSHELRTPLTYLMGYSEQLRQGAELSRDVVRESVEGILKGAERLKRLADDLVQLVDLRSGKAEQEFALRRQRIGDLATLLPEGLARQASSAAQRNVKLVGDVPAALPAVAGDPNLLLDAVGRLLQNAIKFSKTGGGQVTLAARPGKGAVVIEVRDSGIGIAPQQLERVLDLFYQADRPRLEQQGTGCGLTIAQAVVMLHGGTLSIASEPGAGTTCRIELPADAADER